MNLLAPIQGGIVPPETRRIAPAVRAVSCVAAGSRPRTGPCLPAGTDDQADRAPIQDWPLRPSTFLCRENNG